MKIKKRKNILYSFCGLLLAAALLPSAVLPVVATSDEEVVSPALYVLAEENGMAMAAIRGNDIKIDGDDFARAMNLSKVTSVTITETPPMTDGELRVGNTVVNEGQTIKGSNLSLLTYVARGSDVGSSSFRFSVNGSPLELTCKLYMLDEYNEAPTLRHASKNSLNVSTHRNVTLYGTLPCYDPEGDETTIEIVSYPHGILVLTDRHTGEYTYTPTGNYSGRDEFKYVARDKYGNYSASATVSLTVVKPSTSVAYADMIGSKGYNAALTVTEEGIMSGTQVGSSTYFYPDQAVSRGDFIVMAMNAIGIREVAPVDKTVFADDGQMSEQTKSYVGAAYELGYIKGEVDENGKLCFAPDREITRAEAACIIADMLDAPTPTITPSISDSSDIPTWAAASIYSLNYMGIMTTDGGKISPRASLTRADAAEILCSVMNTLNLK